MRYMQNSADCADLRRLDCLIYQIKLTLVISIMTNIGRD
jgi:hypothetical protein